MNQQTMTDRHTSFENFGDQFGVLTFTGDVMLRCLDAKVFEKLNRTMEHGTALDPAIANQVADSMKEWALEHGCTHYCHWFQPLNGATAEKHDAFLSPRAGGGAIAEFSGDMLIRGEPDASSFPTGGIRDTYEARGYTAWDATSPAFIRKTDTNSTLYIPTAFVSWTGEALDEKTPLLRSIQAINLQAMRLLKIFGSDEGVSNVITTLGCEQEYFLVDAELAAMRPDLVICGRTLLGAAAPKGHQLDDHYFAHIPEHVLAFMADAEEKLYQLGIPVKTRHNEVAPGQFEVAPSFENANVAADHQMLLMQVLERTALQHGYLCLLHEKPFAGVNGSGKHNNWAIATDTGKNLLKPRTEPHDQLQFLTFLTAVIRAVDLHADMLRASIASAGNDLRLGGNEAPPAIISVFLGEMLTTLLDELQAEKPLTMIGKGLLDLGPTTMPDLPRDSGDRNRTSPFAFTGNRFEFRAVGSSASVAWPNTILNTIIAESLDYMATELSNRVSENASKEELHKVALTLLREVLKKHRGVCFDGDNYSEKWHKEAAKRNLPILEGTADALPVIASKKSKDLFNKYEVLTPREVDARVNVLYERFCGIVNIEARTLLSMLRTMVIPTAVRQQAEIAEAVAACKAAGVDAAASSTALERITNRMSDLNTAIDELHKAEETEISSLDAYARHIHDVLLPAMEKARIISDSLEEIVSYDLWPLPTYAQMLLSPNA
ncbi:MAG: glutamine synthetase III [Phycisphaerales bacterium]|nr:glutamine synthetase III [Phycisphaerales bacterium]